MNESWISHGVLMGLRRVCIEYASRLRAISLMRSMLGVCAEL